MSFNVLYLCNTTSCTRSTCVRKTPGPFEHYHTWACSRGGVLDDNRLMPGVTSLDLFDLRVDTSRAPASST
jgi:hypothetical protein